MKKRFHISFLAALVWVLSSCQASLKPDELYGKWKYIKVEHQNADPPDSLRKEDLKYQSPSIQFSQNNSFVINWGGKILSHGTFTLNGMEILIKETLPDGTSRTFPFSVSQLTDEKIVFETKGDDGSKVTAVKENNTP